MGPERRSIVAGNWKMHKTAGEARELAAAIGREAGGLEEPLVVVFPPSTCIFAVIEELKGTRTKVGAQNIHWEKEGAFTGEISGRMVSELGCEYVLVGHSERRALFHESSEEVGRKLLAALEAGLKPVLCVGESLQQRESGRTKEVLAEQLHGAFEEAADQKTRSDFVIAYEPVWAIGTGKTATPAAANEVQSFIRAFLREEYGVGEGVPILYGGSVKAENASELMREDEIDGVLVGGASLKAESFLRIVDAGKVSHRS